jgi:hypothetical protein
MTEVTTVVTPCEISVPGGGTGAHKSPDGASFHTAFGAIGNPVWSPGTYCPDFSPLGVNQLDVKKG